MRPPHRARIAAALVAAALPGPALAHELAPPSPGWTFDPLATALLALSITLYTFGLARMGTARAAIAPPWRLACYAAAVGTLVLALFSPLVARTETSFAWHMGQHLLLMLVAAPLLALSNTHLVALFAFPLGRRRRIGRFVNGVPGVRAGASARHGPWIAGLAFAAGLWLWHAPAMYQAALYDGTVHTLEHLTYLITAAIFWRMIATAGDRRLDLGSAIVLVTLVGLQGNLMAALITLAPTPIYAGYAQSAGIADQQMAGILMWVPAGLIYLASTMWALGKFVRLE